MGRQSRGSKLSLPQEKLWALRGLWQSKEELLKVRLCMQRLCLSTVHRCRSSAVKRANYTFFSFDLSSWSFTRQSSDELAREKRAHRAFDVKLFVSDFNCIRGHRAKFST